MKFATLKDGRFVAVARDLQAAVALTDLAPSLIDALRRWPALAPALQARYEMLNQGREPEAFAFDPMQAAAPLPQAPQWLDGSTFENHGRLMEKAFGTAPADYGTHPMVYQGNADDFIGAHDDVVLPSEADGMDCEGEIGVITDAVPMGCPPEAALAHVRLLVLINDVSLRAHAAREMRTGFGWIQAKPCTSFAPVAVTPDELGDAWYGGRLALDLHCARNGERLGSPNGREMTFGFDQLIAYCAYSRRLAAGTVIGSGTVSNRERGAGSTCLTERRAIEMIDNGAARTPFLRSGERIRMEVLDAAGHSVFGAIDQAYIALRSEP